MLLDYQVAFPSAPLRSIVQRYEYIKAGMNDSSSADLLLLPGFETGFLFYFYQSKPLVIKNKAIDFEAAPSMNLIPALNLPSYNIGFQNLEGIRVMFYPGILPKLYDISMSTFRNVLVELQYAIDSEFALIQEQLAEAYDFKAQVTCLERYLLKKLKQKKSSKPVFAPLHKYLLKHGYPTTVKQLASFHGRSDRQFNRILMKEVGLNASEFLQIHRFNQVLKFFRANTAISLSQVAYSFGYVDQSHFIKEFKRLSDQTPKAYLKQMGKEHLFFENFDDYMAHGGVAIESNINLAPKRVSRRKMSDLYNY